MPVRTVSSATRIPDMSLPGTRWCGMGRNLSSRQIFHHAFLRNTLARTLNNAPGAQLPTVYETAFKWWQPWNCRILLENHFLPGGLKGSIGRFITYYNHHQPPSLSWEPEQTAARQRLFPTCIINLATKREDQTKTRSTSGACNTAITPPNITSQTSRIRTQVKLQLVPEAPTTGSS